MYDVCAGQCAQQPPCSRIRASVISVRSVSLLSVPINLSKFRFCKDEAETRRTHTPAHIPQGKTIIAHIQQQFNGPARGGGEKRAFAHASKSRRGYWPRNWQSRGDNLPREGQASKEEQPPPFGVDRKLDKSIFSFGANFLYIHTHTYSRKSSELYWNCCDGESKHIIYLHVHRM